MKKRSSVLLALAFGFALFSLSSCSESCVTCSMAGQDDIEYCSDGSILQNSFQDGWVTTNQAAGYTCE